MCVGIGSEGVAVEVGAGVGAGCLLSFSGNTCGAVTIKVRAWGKSQIVLY